MDRRTCLAFLGSAFLLLTTMAASATPYYFSTGDPDGKIAFASRPDSGGQFQIEAADDFALDQQTTITSASFTGLLTGGATLANIGAVSIEIYRVFPLDSDISRTTGAPTFGTSMVPTRVNSPADVALDSRDSAGGGLTFSSSSLGPVFTALNSVQPGGIHPLPNQRTGGDGAVTGEEVSFSVSLVTPLDLLAGHYFFVPQVEVTGLGSEFLWLSAPRPILPPGTPFSAGNSDLQTWTRDEFLDPDWLRVGTDIVGGTGAPAFNATFSLSGESGASTSVPEPGSLLLLIEGTLALVVVQLKPATWRRAAPASAVAAARLHQRS